ncbi:phosphatase PAP2 family protein [Dactylosporangium salmoneum]|uniref:Inositolphosphotransferase Aur1/Ipt1 domain-containing protein n=1 Tax=Dactylosporangium salmoneum TaxID=53361 RepID=A0ABN3FKD8_9ACTN
MPERRRWLSALALLLWLLLFTRVHSALGKDVAATATANALALQSAERAVHLDIEPGVNHWLAGHLALSHAAVYLYRSYYAVVLGVLVWVFLRHPEVYRRALRTMVAMTALILPVYWAVPMSPPRLALPGITDIVAAYDIWDAGSGGNHYSAMPSLHVGWALWCAYTAWSALRVAHPLPSLLPWLFPLLMTADVLATGNHYVLDVAGSVALFAAAVLAASAWGRLVQRRRVEAAPAQG